MPEVSALCKYREWAVVDVDGEALTQKRLPKLATIKPVLDLEKGKLQTQSAVAPQLTMLVDFSAHAIS